MSFTPSPAGTYEKMLDNKPATMYQDLLWLRALRDKVGPEKMYEIGFKTAKKADTTYYVEIKVVSPKGDKYPLCPKGAGIISGKAKIKLAKKDDDKKKSSEKSAQVTLMTTWQKTQATYDMVDTLHLISQDITNIIEKNRATDLILNSYVSKGGIHNCRQTHISATAKTNACTPLDNPLFRVTLMFDKTGKGEFANTKFQDRTSKYIENNKVKFRVNTDIRHDNVERYITAGSVLDLTISWSSISYSGFGVSFRADVRNCLYTTGAGMDDEFTYEATAEDVASITAQLSNTKSTKSTPIPDGGNGGVDDDEVDQAFQSV